MPDAIPVAVFSTNYTLYNSTLFHLITNGFDPIRFNCEREFQEASVIVAIVCLFHFPRPLKKEFHAGTA
jgi:hypothetical protein